MGFGLRKLKRLSPLHHLKKRFGRFFPLLKKLGPFAQFIPGWGQLISGAIDALPRGAPPSHHRRRARQYLTRGMRGLREL